MKKLLLILTFLISSVFFIDSVSAEDITTFSNYSSATINENLNFYSNIENFNPTVDEAQLVKDFILNEDYKEYGQYYLVVSNNTANMSVVYISDNPNFLTISGNTTIISGSEEYPRYRYYPYKQSSILTDTTSATQKYVTPINVSTNVTNGLYLYSTNVEEIYLTDDTSFTFNDITFENGSSFIKSDDTQLYLSTHYSSKPSIDIDEESKTSVIILEKEYVTDVTLNVKFSSINNDKYLYQYKFIGENEGLWTTKTMENDNFSVKFNENGTLIVRVVDKETNEDVTSAIYTVASINYDLTPYIEIDYITDDGCILDDYTLCTSLRINSHIADFNRYRFIIMDHGQNITEEYKEMTVWKTYYMNTSITIRIVDRTTGTYVDEKHISIISISEETENLGQYITQECKFASIGYNYLCNYYFYNYDPDKYSYYYGSSTTIFEELTLETGLESAFTKTIFKVREGLGQLKEVSYSENTTVYFEVKDKETNEVVYSKTFRVNYDKHFEESGKKNLLDIFKNFREENSSIKKLLEDMWNSIKNSSIYEYIFILVVGTLIVLIIKASNR